MGSVRRWLGHSGRLTIVSRFTVRALSARPSRKMAAAIAVLAALGASALGIAAAGPAWFGTRATFPAGTRPYSVAIGDLNNDGIPDLAVANNGSITVSVLLGDGYGTFGPKTDYAASGQPWYVAIGDLNADGNPDLVTANYTGGNVSIFLGDGTGAFGPRTNIATTGTPFSVVIADFNGDGKPDLATANGGANRVAVLLSTTNAFATTPTFSAPTTFTTGSYPVGLAVGDINADGKLDLVVSNDDNGPNGNSFSVLLGNGAGSFGAKTDFAVGLYPVGVAVADVNGDSKPDVVVANSGSTYVSFFLSTTSQSATIPTFGPRTDLTTGSGQWSVQFADLNGDANLDLAVAKVNSTVSIFPGDGTGSFSARTDFSTGTNTAPHSLAIGDLNGDGKPDLVTANEISNNVSVLLDGWNADITPPVITPTVTGTLGNNGWYTSDVAITWTVTDAETLSPVTTTDCQPQNVTSDTAGITFICRATSSGGTAAGVVTIKRDTAGSPASTVPAPTATAGPVTNFTAGTRPYSVAIGDLNNDGFPDLAVANNGSITVSVLLGNGSGAFGLKTDYATSGQPWYVAIGDLNADGNLDLVTANYTGGNVSIFLGDGTGAFGPRTNVATTGTPFSVVIADFNGDGKPDLATANGGANRVAVLLSTTSPFATTPTFSAPTTFTTGQYPVGLAAGDINSDGRLDLVVTNDDNGPNGNSFSVLIGNGAGSFGAKTDFAVGINPVAVAVADVNGDSRHDVVVANSGTTYVSLFLNTTAQGATIPTFGPRTNLTVGSGPWSVQFGDLNDDGDLDLAVANVNPSTVSVLLGNGTGLFGAKTDFSTGTSTQPHSIAIGDLNGDGKPDLVTANESKANVTILLNSTAPAVPTDATPPAITPTVTGTLGNNGWYTSNVAIAWTVTDPESTPTTTACGAQNVTSDTAGVTFTCSATSAGGSTSSSVTVKRDTTAPTITASAVPAPNGNGWNNTNVTVSYVVDDALSGVDSSASAVGVDVLSAEGAGQSAAGSVTDIAGNTASGTVSGINIDKTAPTITASAAPGPNSNGWNNTDVTVSYVVADTLSGVDAGTSAVGIDVLTAEGAGQSAAGSVTDLAGNTASATVSGINIDRTAPTITASAAPAPNGNGWNNTAVTVSYLVGDTLSGVDAGVSAAGIDVLSADGAGQSASGSVTDRAGNTASATASGINIDATAPAVSIVSPAAAAVYLLNQPVTAGFSCADPLSGPVSCVGTVGNGAPINTSAVGSWVFTVVAIDAAGNATPVTVPFRVTYAFGGFRQPIPLPVSTFKGGSTIPVKFTLTSGSGASVGTAVATVSVNGAAPLGVAAFDASEQQYHYNLKTKGLPLGPMTITVHLDDGTTHSVVVTLR
jgi:hypothetical protein